MKNKIIYLDIDGVLANWVKGACELFNRDYVEVVSSWTPASYKVEEELGVDFMDVIKAVNNEGHDFWANLEEFPWARELWTRLCEITKVKFLTSPYRDPFCYSGKVAWYQRFVGTDEQNGDLIVNGDKGQFSRPGRLLIDDSDKNVDLFSEDDEEKGGDAILFPSYNNQAYHMWEAMTDKEIVDHVVKAAEDWFNSETLQL